MAAKTNFLFKIIHKFKLNSWQSEIICGILFTFSFNSLYLLLQKEQNTGDISNSYLMLMLIFLMLLNLLNFIYFVLARK